MTYWHKMIFKTVHTLQNVIEIRCWSKWNLAF